MVNRTLRDLQRAFLRSIGSESASGMAIGPGFDAGDRMIHAVYRRRGPSTTQLDPSSDDLERIGYLLVTNGQSEFIRAPRGQARRRALATGVAAAMLLVLAIVWRMRPSRRRNVSATR